MLQPSTKSRSGHGSAVPVRAEVHPIRQRLRAMKAKDPARTRLRVALITEKSLYASALVEKRQGQGNMWDVRRQPDRIARRLIGDMRKSAAFLFGFHHPNGFFIHEQQVIRKAGLQRELAHRHAAPGIQVHGNTVLHHPTASGQLGVDILAGEEFGGRGHGIR